MEIEGLRETFNIISSHSPLNKPLLRGMNDVLGRRSHDSGHDFRNQSIIGVVNNNGPGGEDLIRVVLRDKNEPSVVKAGRGGAPQI